MPTIKRSPDFKKDSYETDAWRNNHVVCGIDEVGRGCLAGPVVTAAVILHPGKKSRLIKDSKTLTEKELAIAYDWIIQHSFYAIGIEHQRVIDAINIYQATLRAMQKAAIHLLHTTPQKPHTILVDAMPLHIISFDGDIIHFTHGETKSSSIAAASIIAKVTRDRLMRTFNDLIPGYQFNNHKGYSTKAHIKQIGELGPSILHRTTFIDHFVFQRPEQLSLFTATSKEDFHEQHA